MTGPTADADQATRAARAAWKESHDWYTKHGSEARTQARILDVLVLVTSGAIPVVVVVDPDATVITAILGAVVAVLAGARPLFHWQRNYIGFSRARLELEAEQRLYDISAGPYADPATRNEAYVAAINRIERQETEQWSEAAAPPAK